MFGWISKFGSITALTARGLVELSCQDSNKCLLISVISPTALDSSEHDPVQPGLLGLLRLRPRQPLHADLGAVPPLDLRADHVRAVRLLHGFAW